MPWDAVLSAKGSYIDALCLHSHALDPADPWIQQAACAITTQGQKPVSVSFPCAVDSVLWYQAHCTEKDLQSPESLCTEWNFYLHHAKCGTICRG